MAWDTTKNSGDLIQSSDWNNMVLDQKSRVIGSYISGTNYVWLGSILNSSIVSGTDLFGANISGSFRGNLVGSITGQISGALTFYSSSSISNTFSGTNIYSQTQIQGDNIVGDVVVSGLVISGGVTRLGVTNIVGNLTSTADLSGLNIYGGTAVYGTLVSGTTISGNAIRTTTLVNIGNTTIGDADADTTIISGTLSLTQNGLNTLFVSGNKVGIGTNSPVYMLHLSGPAVIRERISSSDSHVVLEFQPADSSKIVLIDNITSGAETRFRMSNASAQDTTAMTISSVGNVGIGTSPIYKLDVTISGNIVAAFGNPSSAPNNACLLMGDTGSARRVLQTTSSNMYIGDIDNNNRGIMFRAAGNDSMILTSGGLLGVGTTTPGNLIDVNGDDAKVRVNGSTAAAFLARESTGSLLWSEWQQYAGTFRVNVFDGVTTRANVLTITSGGFFGIVTATPAFNLDVIDTTTNKWMAHFKGDNTANTQVFLSIGSRLGNAGSDYGIWSDASNNYFGGKIGVGVQSPAYQIELSTDSAGKPGAGGTWTVVSDERIKKDIELANLNRCYEIVKSVPLKRFSWANNVYTSEQVKDRNNLGWTAQDVQRVFPKAVNSKPFRLANGELIEDCLDLNGGQMYMALYGAVQKLIKEIEILKNK